MALAVVLYEIPNHPRSQAVCRAMLEGITAAGDQARITSSLYYREPEADVAVFYGLAGRLGKALSDYPRAGRKLLFADLGYWGRKDRGRFAGYHKLSVNSRHPTAYFQAVRHDSKRADELGLTLAPWRKGGRQIVITGMGPKGAGAEGYAPLQWEKETAALIRQHSARPILYRAKPNWLNAPPLPGIASASPGHDLSHSLSDAHCVVAHHSNAAVEGLVMGVPAFVVEGVALSLGLDDFSRIETPRQPSDDERRQWMNDLAYTQWNLDEMRSGAAWRHFRDEGLI